MKRKLTALLLVLCMLCTALPALTLSAAAALAAPANVTASLNGVKEIAIRWNPVNGAASYIVYRYTSSTKSYEARATVTGTSYVDQVPGTGYSYYYKVAAKTGDNQTGAQSAACSCYATPAPAVPGGCKAMAGGGKKIVLSWNASANATGYRVYRYASKTKTYTELARTTALTYTDTAPALGYTYYYKIAAERAVDGVTLVGAQSAALSAKPTGGPAVPQNLTATSTGTKEITLRWDADPSATEFIVYRYFTRSQSFEEIGRTAQPTYVDIPQYAGYNYLYVVAASGPVNGEMIVTEQTASVSAFAYAGPGKVTGLKATADGAAVSLRWTAVSDVAYYIVSRADTANGDYAQIGTAESTSYTDTAEKTGTYYYGVQAVRITDGVTLKGDRSAAASAAVSLAPAMPQRLSAASSGVKAVTLRWDASEGAAGYIVYRYTSKSKSYEELARTADLTYTDHLQYDGYTYYYKVAAYCMDGEDELVGPQAGAVGAYAYAAPGKVTGLTAAHLGDGVVSLQWTAVSNASYYIVYGAETADGEYEQIGTTAETTYTDTAEESGTYYCAVQAVRDVGSAVLEGARSAIVSVKVVIAPAMPQRLSAASSGIKAVTLRWDASEGAAGYIVYRYTSKSKSYEELARTADLTYTDHLQYDGYTYYYKVAAYCIDGDEEFVGPQAGAVGAYAYAAPGTVTGLQAERDMALSVALNWTAAKDAQYYRVFRADAANGPFALLGTTEGTAYTDTVAVTGTYYYAVQAVREVSGIVLEGARSASVSARAVKAPDQPQNLQAVSSGLKKITLRWSASEDAVGYIVYRYTSSTKTYEEIARTANLTYTDLLAYSGYTYYYKVASYGLDGEDELVSPQAGAVGAYSYAKPAAVQDLTAAADVAGAVSLQWSAVSKATGYIVYFYDAETGGLTLIGDTAGLSYDVEGLDSYTVYSFKVVARTELEGETLTGNASAAVSVRTLCVHGGATREQQTTDAPTCSREGLLRTETICEICGAVIATVDEPIEKLPHTPAEDAVIENETAGTCVTPASYDEVFYCTVCGGECSRTKVETETDSTNHVGGTIRMNAIEATCISGGNTGAICCASCYEIFELGTPTPVDPANHVRDDDGNLYTEIRNVSAGTCAVPGNTGDLCCTQCNAVITPGDPVYVPHTEVADPAEPANCGYPGKTAGSHCSVCGQPIVAQSVIPATGQHAIDATKDKHTQKSGTNCQEMGYSRTCYECHVCHKYFADKNGTSELSAAEVETPGSHRIEQNTKFLVLYSSATCTSKAKYYYTCRLCGYVDTSRTPWTDNNSTIVGHNYVADPSRPAIAPTCLANGSFYLTCSMCGAQSNQTETVAGSKLGHDYSILVKTVSEATCTKGDVKTYKCSRCGIQTDITGAVDPNAHPEDKISSEMTNIIAPTCTAPGEYYISSVCSACGKILAQNEYHYVAPVPHSLRTNAAKAATCTAAGNILYYSCNNCGRLFRDSAATQQINKNDTVLPALGHRSSGVYVRVYSRQTTCTVDGLYNEVDYCANGCGTVMDTRPQQIEARFNHMRNGVLAEENVAASAATCTEAAHEAGTRCTICHAVLSGLAPIAGQPALGHDFSIAGSPLGNNVQGFYCSRCNAMQPNPIATYNALVNAIKGSNYGQYYTVSLFSKTSTVSNYENFSSKGVVNVLGNVEEQFASEMRKTETTYGQLLTNRWIDGSLYLKSTGQTPQSIVSLLANGDATVSVEKLSSLSGSQFIDPSIPNSTAVINNHTYDIDGFRSVSINEPVIAVTVTLKQETYTPAGGISGVGPNDLTAMQKFNGKDIRSAAAQYGENGVLEDREEDSGYEMVSRMELKRITSNGSATYYFKASNYEPIAAVYNTSVMTKQNVSMTIKILVSTGSIKVEPYVTETTQEYFLFSSCFPTN